MTPHLKRVYLYVACVCYGLTSHCLSASAAIVLSNLDAPQVGPADQTVRISTSVVAQKFIIGPVDAILNSITVRTVSFDPLNTYYPVILSDNGSSPGSVLKQLSPYTLASDGNSFYYLITFPAAGFPVSANSTYWFGMTAPRVAQWFVSAAPTQTSNAGWKMVNVSARSPSPYIDSPETLYMQIDATLLPEPSLALGVPMLLLLPRRRRMG